MIPFLDLNAQYQGIKEDVNKAVLDVLESSAFVLGPAVKSFEADFANYCESKECVALNSGTSALHMALLTLGVGDGDEVITVSSTFIATIAAIRYTGARPVMVDVDPQTWTMDVDKIEAAITPRTKVIMPVHLHGRVADMDGILDIAKRHGLAVVEDAAQAHGATYKGRKAGSFGDIGCFSFYPGKNLGAYGEGGAAVTSNPDYAKKMRMLRDWGQAEKHHHVIEGFNTRMDGIQGAVLGVKLKHLDVWTDARRSHAKLYDQLLTDASLEFPIASNRDRHVYHVYAVLVKNRETVQKKLNNAGVGSNIHYPVPVHMQPAHSDLGYGAGDFPVSEKIANEFLSLPMFAELTEAQVQETAETLVKAL